jgi:hypothetical protein
MNTQSQTTVGKTRSNGATISGVSKLAALRDQQPKALKLEEMTTAQIVAMSTADVRANLRTLIDYSDSLLTRSAVIYTVIMTTAESMSMKATPFFISAFAEVWPKSDKADTDGSFPLLGLSTVEKAIRDKKLSLTELQADAYRKVNAFNQWVKRQKEQKPEEEGAQATAKTLPKKLVDAIAKLRGLIDNAQEVEVIEQVDGHDTIVMEKVVPVSLIVEIVEALSVL